MTEEFLMPLSERLGLSPVNRGMCTRADVLCKINRGRHDGNRSLGEGLGMSRLQADRGSHSNNPKNEEKKDRLLALLGIQE